MTDYESEDLPKESFMDKAKACFSNPCYVYVQLACFLKNCGYYAQAALIAKFFEAVYPDNMKQFAY